MIRPFATDWAEMLRLFRVKDVCFRVVKISTADHGADDSCRGPPDSRVPPITTAAIASSSYS